MHINNNIHLDMRKKKTTNPTPVFNTIPPAQKKETKKQFPPPQGLKGRKEIDEEDRPDLIHAMSIPGGPDNRILEFRPGLARSWRLWRLWSKNVPIYRKRKKRK